MSSGGQFVEFSVLKRVVCAVISVLRRFEKAVGALLVFEFLSVSL
jgi:hypothetical protein